MNTKDQQPLQLSVAFEGQPESKMQLQAHVFDNAGRHITTADIDEKGYFNLNLSAEQLKYSRLFIAPYDPVAAEKRTPPTTKDMERVNAYQPVLNTDHVKENFYELRPIPELKWSWWWWCTCRVTGTVLKSFSFAGTTQTMPVCNARVHICEVDRWPIIVWRLPDDIIYRIKEELIKQPIPIPGPGPVEKQNFSVFQKSNSAASLKLSKTEADTAANISSQRTVEANQDFLFQLNTDSVFHLKQTLSLNPYLIFPYFCWWPWIWPYFYTCQELAVVETDEQGRFDTDISYFCFGDHPDIYVWVEYLINGVWTTVYYPSIACNTYWDYACGTDISITVTDPRVQGCGHTIVEGDIMEIVSIGTSAFTSHIQQRSITETVQGVSFNSLGLTDFYLAGIPGVHYLNPFGEVLGIIADFGSTLPNANLTHYRVSYKKTSDADIPANWTALTDSAPRYYIDEINDGINPAFLQTGSFDLKDPGFAELYRIPQDLAVNQVEIPVPPGLVSRKWASERFTVAAVDSRSLDNDFYDIKIELYNTVGGTPQLQSVPKSTFQIPDIANVNVSLPLYSDTDPLPLVKPYPNGSYPNFHPGDYLIPDGAIPADALAFKMTVRIDNNHCTAIIDDVLVKNSDGTSATSDPDCGFVAYKDATTSKVKFSFEASHPNNFAVFGFNVIRGNGNPCPDADTSGMVIGDSSNGYHLVSGKFTKKVTVQNLLGSCSKAAFSENLNVDALATNGSRLLWEYDQDDVAAFALELP